MEAKTPLQLFAVHLLLAAEENKFVKLTRYTVTALAPLACSLSPVFASFGRLTKASRPRGGVELHRDPKVFSLSEHAC